jgi:peptide/nickel transport system substrate-binding protein
VAAVTLDWPVKGRPGRDGYGGRVVRDSYRHVTRKLWLRFAALGAAVALVAAWGGHSSSAADSGAPAQRKPRSGGSITYGLEAPTTNFCIPNAQLAISGIVVTTALYDTLTVPNKDGKYVPYLAQAVEHDPAYTSWTIRLRPNVTFHNGQPLDADALKVNLDAWTGKHPSVSAPLLGFVFSNVASVDVVDPMTVRVNMKSPWVEFDQYLWGTGRFGIAAPEQLSSPNCQSNMIGTGPFRLQSFDPVTGNVDVVKNPNYWRSGFPYLDEIKFVPIPDGAQRLTQFTGGALDITHEDSGQYVSQYEGLGNTKMTKQPPGHREVTHTLPNITRPPLDDPNARKAIAMAIDRKALNELVNDGRATLANGVFDSKVEGYLKNAGYPKYNPKEARKLVQEYKAAHGGSFEFSYQSTTDQLGIDVARFLKSQLDKVGITLNLPQPIDQPTIINQAIGGQVDAFGWRNYPGLVGDTMYVWFYGTTQPGGSGGRNPVNFNHINDPQVNQALDQARAEPDPAKRRQLYEDFNKAMTSNLYNFWGWYTPWYIPTKSNVNGVIGPNLPDASGKPGSEKPTDVLAGYHQLLGLSLAKG